MYNFLTLIKSGVYVQYVASLTAASSIFACGIDYGWTSPYLPQLLSNSSSIPTTSNEGSWSAIFPLVSSPVGALFAALFVDKVGRKKLILLSGIPMSILYVILAFAPTIWTISAIRLLIGFIDGALWTVVPTYVAEISEPEHRGFLTSAIALVSNFGILFINIIGPFTSIFTSSLIAASIPLVQSAIFLMMPETPYYYLKKFRLQDAEKSLKILRGSDDVESELQVLSKAVRRQEGTEKAKHTDLFTVASNRRAVLIFIISCIAVEFSGKPPIVFYTTKIFQDAGSSLNANVLTIIFGIVGIVVFFLIICFIDRFGKRPMIITSTAGCSLSIFVLGIHTLLQKFPDFYPDSLGWIPIVALVSYNLLYSAGLAFVQVIVLGELFPTSVKGSALAFAEIFSAIVAASSGKLFQIVSDAYGMYLPFFCYSISTACMCFLLIRMFPETKGKTLEEIQLFLIAETKMN